MDRTIFEFRNVDECEKKKRRMLALVFGQEFQLTLTGVNQTPNVHLGLGSFGVEIREKETPQDRTSRTFRASKVISGIRMAQ